MHTASMLTLPLTGARLNLCVIQIFVTIMSIFPSLKVKATTIANVHNDISVLRSKAHCT